MKIGIAKEIGPSERRVAVAPDAVRQIKAAGYEVLVEAGAGAGAYLEDRAYEEAGASIVLAPSDLWSRSDVILKIQPPLLNAALGQHEADLLNEGSTLICMLRPLSHIEVVRMLAKRRVTSFSMDMMPRSTRAQRMDALSSMSTIAGYKAVLMAADMRPRRFLIVRTSAGHARSFTGADRGSGRRRTPGDCHGPAARSGGGGLRRASGREGRGGEPGRDLRGA